MTRRLAVAALAALAAANVSPAADPPAGPFRHRGYYTIVTRYPTAGLDVWKHVVDCVHADGGNLLIHWVQGAFRSKKFPETWQHNKDHANVEKDFTRELIAYAHAKGVRVLLGFSPFAYDGVNRHTAAHPELAATGKDGKPTREFGIFCWGRSLCPAQPGSQKLMLDYVREMYFDFYPEADGLFVESSDYSTCHCPKCGPKHFENEYRFVRAIADEVWAKKPDAMVVVYPHYFSGDETANTEGKAVGAKMPFDPRFALFFTPHSTKVNKGLIAKAKDALWWDMAMIFGSPAAVRDGARRARADGFTGYTPTLEAYSYVPTRPEYDGAEWLVGRRQVPFGFGWVPPDKSPYDELPLRVTRVAYREFCRDPDLSLDEFYRKLGREMFGDGATDQRVKDLLTVQAAFARERDWFQPSPLAEPLRVKEWKAKGKLPADKAASYRAAVAELRAVADRNAGKPGAVGELGRVAKWVADQWAGDSAALIGLAGGD